MPVMRPAESKVKLSTAAGEIPALFNNVFPAAEAVKSEVWTVGGRDADGPSAGNSGPSFAQPGAAADGGRDARGWGQNEIPAIVLRAAGREEPGGRGRERAGPAAGRGHHHSGQVRTADRHPKKIVARRGRVRAGRRRRGRRGVRRGSGRAPSRSRPLALVEETLPVSEASTHVSSRPIGLDVVGPGAVVVAAGGGDARRALPASRTRCRSRTSRLGRCHRRSPEPEPLGVAPAPYGWSSESL